MVPFAGEESEPALPRQEKNEASVKVSTRRASSGLGLARCFQWHYSLEQILMESSYGFFQAKINIKLTSLLCAYAATYKQTGYLHNCLKNQLCKRRAVAPVYMCLCIYIHTTYAIYNVKKIF